MTVSVVIPAHGRIELLIRCLLSLKAVVDEVPRCEICVVDDGSGLDESAVRATLAAGDSFIWRAFTEQRGRSAARNKGVRSTSGDIVVFLDSDMEVRPGFLNSHAAIHKDNPHVAAVGHIDWPDHGSFYRYIGTRGVKKLLPGDTLPPWYFVTGNASVERCDLPDDKPFREDLPAWGGEDLDLGLRLGKAGVSFRYAPDAVSYHNFDGDLNGHVKRTFRYGRDVVPRMIADYPEVRNILRLDLLKSPIWRFAVNPVFRNAALYTARVLDAFPLPDRLYDYLTFAAYAHGYLSAAEDSNVSVLCV